jgi:metal-responsive CopG/Arc/MetJ family transcriptional regulator
MDALAMRKPMGRPPLGLVMTTIRLPKRIGGRIDAVLQGKEKRSDLIRAAIERELQRRESEAKGKKRPK